MERLYISPRTLQDYRNKKIIPYTQFAGKILYKESDLERILKNSYREKDKMRLEYWQYYMELDLIYTSPSAMFFE